jgi:Uma2 family endonuclease
MNMELLIESVVAERELSAYEIERNKPMPSKNHGIIQSNIIFELKTLYKQRFTLISEVEIQMPERPNCVPDISIYPKMTVNFWDDELVMTEMPLVAIEIVSPTQSDNDIIKKINRYFEAGVQSCWLVMPSFQAISVYSGIGKYQFFSSDMILKDTIANIELPLMDVFA